MGEQELRAVKLGRAKAGDLVVECRLTGTVDRLRSGTISPSAYVDAVAERVRRVNPRVRALLPERARRSRLRREAVALTAQCAGHPERPPLYGAVVGVKDLIAVAGLPTRAGSRLPPELFAAPEASVVTALRRSGALILGKTALDEFAYAEPPAARNPHNLGHTPGGSSGGSAAAVAAGLCPLALGTQTTRSVIGPAAFCGVVGFKPTFGRVPIDGVVPLAPSFDTVGMLTQDVASVQLVTSALIPDWRPVPVTCRPILGVPNGRMKNWTLPEGRSAFAEQVRQLRNADYDVREIPFFSDEAADEMDRRAMTVLHGEMARVHARWYAEYAQLYRPRTVRGIERGRAISDLELDDARTFQSAFRDRVTALMDVAGIDLWITPASAGPAPRGFSVTGWGGMTTAWSFAGLPCVTVPAGLSDDGLPFGLQAVARFGQDEVLLAVALDLEATIRALSSGP